MYLLVFADKIKNKYSPILYNYYNKQIIYDIQFYVVIAFFYIVIKSLVF